METLSRDVLPAGARRRLSRRDGRLPAILMGELMAGMALGMVWPALTAPPPPIPQTAMTAVRAPAPLAPLAPPPLPVAVHVPKHSPRNPFGVPQGVEAHLQPSTPTVAVPGAPPSSPTTVVLPPVSGGVVPPPAVGVGAPPPAAADGAAPPPGPPPNLAPPAPPPSY